MFNIFRKVVAPRPMRTTSVKIAMLGVIYPIKIIEGARNSTTIKADHIAVTLHPATRDNFDRYIAGWYRRAARAEFHRAMEKWLPEFERLDYIFPTPQLKIYHMRKAWGRCYYTKAVITLNMKLFRLPQECIDYILLHELAHMVAHDHGPLFRAILDKIDPQWRQKEAKLRLIEQQKSLLL